LINDTIADGHYGCFRVMRTIERLAAGNGMAITARSPVHGDWQKDRAVVAAMSDADIVIVNGEGTVHSNRPDAKRLVRVGEYCAAAGKPAVLINTSWFDNGQALAEMARGFAIIAARESESERQLKASGLDCVRMADLALHEPVAGAARRNGLGVTDSVLADMALGLDRLRRSRNGVPVNLFYGRRGLSGLRFFLRLYGARQNLGSPGALAASARAAATAYGSQMDSIDALLERIGKLELLVTGRFHAAIFALASLTPVLAVESNTPKISATLKDAGAAPWRVRRDADFDEETVRNASRWSGEEEANIRDFLSDNRRRQAELFKDMAALAS
jgi:polysaccharide pyruvyl transferase WcaK-like protein